ncbi:uncharacterized protein LOC125469910 isoform X3 [Pyrus x bretschneideri]|uniref:uncharacterized protein LOC125469910 isoform X3 n=1 Tax=Pyrus x bretschneideri TaxID=225117 RepID=UPI00202F72BE|nr:uncharacterized protein LOC125469910 isoform X3 [Pyrus x bretschneideri]
MGLNVLMSGCVVCSELRSTSGRRCMKATWSWSTVSSFTVPDDGSEPLAIPTVREVNNNKILLFLKSLKFVRWSAPATVV